MQVLSLLENTGNLEKETSFVSQGYAGDLSERYPKTYGSKLGALLDDGIRSGSVCLNSLIVFYKWILAFFMLRPGLVSAG